MKIYIQVKPQSRTEKVTSQPALDGSCSLVVCVKDPPIDGKANSAALSLIAKTLGVRRADIEIVRGHTSRHKALVIEGDEHLLTQKIQGIDLK